MSEKLPTVQVPKTDLTPKELLVIEQFKENGLPGVSDVPEDKLYKMLDMYMTGSTYTQIANFLGVRRNIVIYLAHVSNWYEMKQEGLNEIQENLKNRIIEAKTRNSEFMLLLVQSWQKKMTTHLKHFLSTNDPEHMETIDLKEMAALMKAIDMVNALDNTGKSPKGQAPTVGLNLGDGVDIEKTGENTVSITPKPVGSLLQQYANKRREEEKASLSKKPDIEVNKGETDED